VDTPAPLPALPHRINTKPPTLRQLDFAPQPHCLFPRHRRGPALNQRNQSVLAADPLLTPHRQPHHSLARILSPRPLCRSHHRTHPERIINQLTDTTQCIAGRHYITLIPPEFLAIIQPTSTTKHCSQATPTHYTTSTDASDSHGPYYSPILLLSLTACRSIIDTALQQINAIRVCSPTHS
jgi:hypothetical protein